MVKSNNTSIVGKVTKKSLRYQRDKDRELVKGIFNFHEVRGETLSFNIRIYKEDPVETYVLTDGETYSIPLGVAKHLNKSGSYPVHAHAVDANGKPIAKIGHNERRYGFQSLEFIDPEDFSTVDPGIITVEKV